MMGTTPKNTSTSGEPAHPSYEQIVKSRIFSHYQASSGMNSKSFSMGTSPKNASTCKPAHHLARSMLAACKDNTQGQQADWWKGHMRGSWKGMYTRRNGWW